MSDSVGGTPLEAAAKKLYELAYYAEEPKYYLQNVIELEGNLGSRVRITIAIKRGDIYNGEALRIAEDIADACAAADLSKVRWEQFKVVSNGPVWYQHNDNLPHESWARAALTAAIDALGEQIELEAESCQLVPGYDARRYLLYQHPVEESFTVAMITRSALVRALGLEGDQG